jgi:hypothetical protein
MRIYWRMFQRVDSNQTAIKQYLTAEREAVEISGSSGNPVPADEKGQHLSAVNSPCGGF